MFVGGAIKIRLPRGQYVTREGEFFGAKRLLTLGKSSKALVLPRRWVKAYAPEDWVEIEVNGETGEIVLRPLTAAKLEAIHDHRKRTSAASGRVDANHEQVGGRATR